MEAETEDLTPCSAKYEGDELVQACRMGRNHGETAGEATPNEEFKGLRDVDLEDKLTTVLSNSLSYWKESAQYINNTEPKIRGLAGRTGKRNHQVPEDSSHEEIRHKRTEVQRVYDSEYIGKAKRDLLDDLGRSV